MLTEKKLDILNNLLHAATHTNDYKTIYLPSDEHKSGCEYLLRYLGFDMYQKSIDFINQMIQKIDESYIKTYDNHFDLYKTFEFKKETVDWLLSQLKHSASILDRNECYTALFTDIDLDQFNDWYQDNLN